MDKYTKRRMVAFSAILAVAGIGGFSIVKHISESQVGKISQDVYAMQDEPSTVPATSRVRNTESATSSINTTTHMTSTSEVTTTEVTTTTEPAHLYTQPTKTFDSSSASGVYLTESEIYLLSTLVYLEGGTESFECQKAIASTVINRMLASGDTLIEVIYAENQFSVANKLDDASPSESSKIAVDEVLNYGSTIPLYVTYFRAGEYHDWGDQVPYCRIDNTYFTYSQAMLDEYKSQFN